jgi:hypothetical protein
MLYAAQRRARFNSNGDCGETGLGAILFNSDQHGGMG